MPSQPEVQPQPTHQQSIETQLAKKEKNVLGIVSLVLAIIGFIFACIPGAFILGWIALPIAFILSIVSLFMKGKGKGLGIAALIIAIVGTIVGVIVFIGTAVSAVDEAFSGGEVSVTAPEGTTEENPTEAEQGTRDNPYPVGSAITQGDWTVAINSVNLDATAQMAEANLFNEPAPDGSTFVLINVTATYNGTKADGDYPFVSVDFVTAGGNTISSSDTFAVAPEYFDLTKTLYEGASTTGNIAIAVPNEEITGGTLAVRPHMLGDKVFVAVQ